jgi:hypothetical protein
VDPPTYQTREITLTVDVHPNYKAIKFLKYLEMRDDCPVNNGLAANII